MNNNIETRLRVLEEQVKFLESERISTINSLYEIENSLSCRIDKIAPDKYNLNKYSLGEK
tara:strand:- start:144 stop:323 length:180 start_codon:yes stop_codon:yes gene_type:complete